MLFLQARKHLSDQESDSVVGILRLLPLVNNPLNRARARRNTFSNRLQSRNFLSFWANKPVDWTWNQ
jgi:hypothetical protein